MVGIFFALVTAIFKGGRDVVSKRALKKAPVFAVLSISTFIAFLASVPFALSEPIPEFNWTFASMMLISTFLVFTGQAFYMKSIKLSEISHVVPLIALSPIFTLILSAIFIGEVPSLYGIVGVVVIVVGSYIANINREKSGFLTPFIELKDHKGARLMLLVAAIWTVSPLFEKVGIQASSSLYWAMISLFLLSILNTILAVQRNSFADLSKKYIGFIILLGVLQGISYTSQMVAYSLTNIAYVVAIKRLSMLVTIILGYLLFNETKFKQRLLGGILVFIGVLFIVLA